MMRPRSIAASCAAIIISTFLRAHADQQAEPIRLLLIGDTGHKNPAQNAVLAEAARRARAAPSVVVFLGDNAYDKGLSRDDVDDARFQPLVDLADVAHVVIVPGNHDWDQSSTFFGRDPLAIVRRQTGYVARRRQRAAHSLQVLPPDGCPGPSTADFGMVRLVAIDTEWMLRDGKAEKLQSARTRTCTSGNGDAYKPDDLKLNEVQRRLKAVLGDSKDKKVIVVAHHPVVSHGSHGQGRLIGALGEQDLTRNGYKDRIISKLHDAFRSAPPFAYAAGHEHNLQVIWRKDDPVRYLISGSGSETPTSPYGDKKQEALSGEEKRAVVEPRPGFLQIDFDRDGNGVLTLVAVDVRTHTASECTTALVSDVPADPKKIETCLPPLR